MTKRNFIFLWFSNFFFFLTVAFFHMFPNYLTKLGASKTYIGSIMGLVNFIQIFLILLYRNKVDYVNKKKILLYIAGLSCLVYVGFYFFANLYTIPFLRLLQGFVISIGFPFGMAFAIDIIPKDKMVGMLGIFGISGAISNFFGPYLTEIINKHFPFKYVFLMSSLSSLLWLFCLSLTKRSEIKAEKKEYEENAPVKLYLHKIPIAILFGALFSSLFFFISDYAEKLEIAPISIFFQAYTISLLAIRLLLNKKLNQWTKKSIIITGFLIGTLALFNGIMLKFYHSVYLLALIGLFYGSAHGLLYPTINALFVDVTPHRSGKATLIFIVFLNVGLTTSPVIYGLIADLSNYNVMYTFATVLILSCAIYFGLNKNMFKIKNKPLTDIH